jgi:hypothetical protein
MNLKTKFLFFICLLVTVICKSQLPFQYQLRFGTSGDDAATGIVKDLDGSIVLTGYALDPISNQTRQFAWKLANNFSLVWQKRLGRSISQGKAIQKVFNTGYITTGFALNGSGYDAYITRMDLDGDTLWTKYIGTSSWDFANQVIVTKDSGFIIVGKSYGTPTFDADAWVTKLDKNGTTLWSKFYGGYEDDEFTDIEETNNHFIISGTTRSAGDTAGDFYFVKINAQGDSIITRKIQKPAKDFCNSILKISPNIYHCVGGSIELPRTIVSNAQLGIDSNLNTINTYTNFNTNLPPYTYYTEATLLSDLRIANTGSSYQGGFTMLDGISQIETTNGNNIYFTFVGGVSAGNDEGLAICSNFEDSSYTLCGYTEGHGAIQKDIFITKCDKTGNTNIFINTLSINELKPFALNSQNIKFRSNSQQLEIWHDQNKTYDIAIFHSNGQLLYKQLHLSGNTIIPIDKWKGIFVLNVTSEDAVLNKKLMLN